MPVRTDKGLIPIQKIKVGDRVLARNEHSGRIEYEKVVGLVPPHPSKLVKLQIAGEAHALEPTPNHPFFARRAGQTAGTWIPAGQLERSDQVLTARNGWRKVLSVTPANGEQTVYNFEVDADHDYFAGNEAVLVHNALCNGINVMEGGFDHVVEGHTVGGTNTAGNSIFNGDAQDVANWIQSSQTTDGIVRGNLNIAYVNYAGDTVGWSAAGQYTSVYTVITDLMGNLVTAFPGFPLP